MKNSWPYLLLIIAIFWMHSSRAATGKDSLPGFKILLSNGVYFSPKDVPRNKAVILIYFAPDCEHCQKLMQAFFPKIKALKNAEIILVTFKPIGEMVAFEKQYQTQKYPNMVVGTEGNTFFLRYYYKLTKTPFTALYNSKGKLVYSSRNENSVTELIRQFQLMMRKRG